MSGGFPAVNGFALRADLERPELREELALCREASRAFSGSAQLGWSRQWEYPYALANLPADGRGLRLLDAGCGWRFFTPLLARRGFDVDACDLDGRIGARLAALARGEGLALRFSREDLSRLRYPDDAFDFACCISVLEHLRDPGRVVEELRRCLRPGGALILTFDVSVAGDRDVPVARAAALIEQLERRFAPRHAFRGRELLRADALAASSDVLRSAQFRRAQPELLPWRFVSRAGLRNLLRGRLGRPFFDLAVVGLVLEKPRS